jgi:hypothetical protein
LRSGSLSPWKLLRISMRAAAARSATLAADDSVRRRSSAAPLSLSFGVDDVDAASRISAADDRDPLCSFKILF